MLKNFLNQIMLLNDSGKLLKSPFKWLYVLTGVLSFVPAIAFIAIWIWQWNTFESLLLDNFWGNFVMTFILTLFVYILIIFGWIAYLFWLNRKNNIEAVIETGSRVVAIPLVADINQCIGEINSLFIAIVPIAAAILTYIACLLTNGFGFYTSFGFLWQILIIAGIALISALAAYINLLLTRFVSERIRLVAMIGNDVHKMTISDEKTLVREADSNDVAFKMPEINQKEKKGALFALGFAVIFALCVALGIFLSTSLSIRKSVFEELTEEQIMKSSQKLENFPWLYQEARYAANVAEEAGEREIYEDISYKDLYDYKKEYYDNEEYKKEISDKALADYDEVNHKPLSDTIQLVKDQWAKYINDNDPSKYISVETVTGYTQEKGWWSTYYRPNFYFKVSANDAVSDASLTFKTVNEYGNRASYTSEITLSLSEMQQINSEKNGNYWKNIDDSDYWDDHSMVVTVNRVTLSDGSVIDSDKLKSVPSSALEYIKNPSEETEYAFIRQCIKEDYPSKEEFVRQQLGKNLMEEDELIYNFISKYIQ